MEGDNGGNKEKGCQRTCIMDPWTKPKGRGGGQHWKEGEGTRQRICMTDPWTWTTMWELLWEWRVEWVEEGKGGN